MNIAVFDVESNGMTGSSVLSASSIVFDGGGALLDVFNRFYLPQEPTNRYAVRIHGLTPGRILALREETAAFFGAPRYFLEDWPDLIEFWESWNVAGVVVHNLPFDISFLPEIAQSALRWWCSMRGLTLYCAIPKRRGNVKIGEKRYKWPKLSEAADIICNSPSALTPTAETERIEAEVGAGFPHVSLFDCFELYRMVSRIAQHREDLLQFAPSAVAFRPPKMRPVPITGEVSAPDRFTANILRYERKLRSLLRTKNRNRASE
jgi:DNA polymerase III epsilon subunit-like protein